VSAGTGDGDAPTGAAAGGGDAPTGAAARDGDAPTGVQAGDGVVEAVAGEPQRAESRPQLQSPFIVQQVLRPVDPARIERPGPRPKKRPLPRPVRSASAASSSSALPPPPRIPRWAPVNEDGSEVRDGAYACPFRRLNLPLPPQPPPLPPWRSQS
jgi:hypothetical protein